MLALPIIDLKSFISAQELGDELVRVSQELGFFYITGHNISNEQIRATFGISQRFFQETAKHDKAKFASGSGGIGYTGIGDERLSGKGDGDLKESFYLRNPASEQAQPLPQILEDKRSTLAGFYSACEDLSKVILEGLAIGLHLEPNYLSKHHDGLGNRMRLLHYPALNISALSPDYASRNGQIDSESVDTRAGTHSDYGSITLLIQQPHDKGGLQVLQTDTETWIDIPPLPSAIVVNIGDALEFWTAGRLRSTVHRVVFPKIEGEAVARYSIPFFVQPDEDVLLEPMGDVEKGEFLNVLERKGYVGCEPVTAGEHLRRRLEGTYA